MNLQECYSAIGGDYQDALKRLMNERIVQKFVFKFLDDPSFDNLIRSMDEKDYKEAFRAAHTIKGVCQNLSFSRLCDSSSRLTEALREEKSENYQVLLEQVKADYEKTASGIRELKASV